MAEGKITLEIVTPRGVALREIVDDVAAPSVDGEFGVLPGHLPILASLRTGIVTYHKGSEEKRLTVSDGFIEVKDDHALLLTDKVATRDQIDPVPVRLELKEVDEQLAQYNGDPAAPEWRELVARELWAAAQLELYGDPPTATQRPHESYGPPAAAAEGEAPAASSEGESEHKS